ncbi:MAG: AraC family transcriptional regulator [Clostridia bacterium]|nr:AraC family transcriptional regulator [Clostridia bacterium]
MFSRLDLKAERRVLDANYCIMQHPVLHPDRTLDCHELIYMLDGEWTINQGGEELTLKNDDVALLFAGEHHFGTVPCRPDTKMMYLNISFAEGDMKNCGKDSRFADVFPSVISCRSNSRINRLFADAIYYSHIDSVTGELILSSLVKLVLCEISNLFRVEPSANLPIYRTVKMMQKEPDKFFSVDDLAKVTFVSTRTLSELFKKTFGLTPHQYQIREKINLVKKDLSEYPGLSLRVLAERYGFTDEFHLSKVFKKETGISPREYRHRMKQIKNP